LWLQDPANRAEAIALLAEQTRISVDDATICYEEYVPRKVHSLALGIVFGLSVGLVLAFIIAQLQHGYYFQIMLPGGMVGLIVGYATQKYGRSPQLPNAASVR